ncbi:trypsin-like peptidase domain-containing protein [Streptomyces sp. GMY02]|uniref:trypsin-like peptidase domain-containing protein n=1 Tax=Streptomyces sp. GMY02 TaxID=1333528 RepID=UPI002665301D|nr:trypsin-like peptidase domain-containing protein [Streptomyces sp. GMY02]
MEFDRRVQIRLRRANGRTGFGSGYLVAPRLVLTAAHVLDDGSGTGTLVSRAMVSRPGPPPRPGEPGSPQPSTPSASPGPPDGARPFGAAVRWSRRDKEVDAAVLEVEGDSGWEPPASFLNHRIRPPVRWGRLIGSRRHPVTALGFPRLQQEPDGGRRLDEQLDGHVSPGKGSLAGLYTVSSLDPLPSVVPLRPGTGATPWSGFSGGPAFCGGLLVGVVRDDLLARHGTRLTATPAAAFLADDELRALITGHGWEPLLEPAEPVHLLTPAALTRDFRSPAALLKPDAEAVPFHGRTAELEQLRGWCHEEPGSFSVHVVTGPGGQGKSRLARELGRTLRDEGWVTGDLWSNLTDTGSAGAGAAGVGTHDTGVSDPAGGESGGQVPDATDPYGLHALDTTLPMFLVADHAETRPRLVRRLVERLRHTEHRTRLLLIARSDGLWRTAPLDGATDATEEILATAAVTELPPLLTESEEPAARATAFTEAAAGLSRLLPQVNRLEPANWGFFAIAVRPPAALMKEPFASALSLQMTALVALLELGSPRGQSVAGEPLEAALLRHEQRFWEETAEAPEFRLNLPTPVLRRAVAVAAACGAADLPEAMRAVAHDTQIAPDKVRATAEWLRALHPPPAGRYWGALQPDRIAEYHASDLLTESGGPLRALMCTGSAAQQAQLITVLARAASAHYNAFRTARSDDTLRALDDALDAALDHAPSTDVATARDGGDAAGGDRSSVRASSRTGPDAAPGPGTSRDVGPGALHPDALRDAVNALPRPSHTTGALSLRLLRHREAGLRRLVGVDQEAHLPALVDTLAELAVRAAERGLEEDARGAAEEAASLEALLVEKGHRREADASGKQSPSPLAGQPAAGAEEEDLAWSFWEATYAAAATGSVPLVEFGPARLAALRDRTSTLFGQALRNPDAWEPALARTLCDFSVALGRAGQWREAVVAARAAACLHEWLAGANPVAEESGRARALEVTRICAPWAGHSHDGHRAVVQLADLYGRLAQRDPDGYRDRLTDELTAREHADETPADVRTADVPTTGRNTEQGPAGDGKAGTGGADSPAPLSEWVARLAELNKQSDAVHFARQAVEILRRLDRRAEGDQFTFDFAGALHDLAVSCVLAEEPAWAGTAAQEAVDLYRRLGEPVGPFLRPALAEGLATLSGYLAWQGRIDKAVKTAQEAAGIYRDLDRERPGWYTAALEQAMSLGVLYRDPGTT